MVTTTIKEAEIGKTYKNTGGATVVVVPDQKGVSAGYRRISVNGGKPFVSPDGVQLFLEPEETFSTAVAALLGAPPATIKEGVGRLTDQELDELADADTRSDVLRIVGAEQQARSQAAAKPPAAVDMAHTPDRVAPTPPSLPPSLEPDGWLPQTVTCGACGAKATTEWSAARAGEILANHRDPKTSKLCQAVGHPPDAAAGMRSEVETAQQPVNPAAFDLGQPQLPDPRELAGPPPADLGDTVEPALEGGDPWNGIDEEDHEQRMLLVKHEANLTNLARLLQTTRLARLVQEIERQSLAVGEVKRHADRMRDTGAAWDVRELSASEIVKISRRSRTQEARPGVARLALSLVPEAEAVVKQAQTWRDAQLAAAIRVADRGGIVTHTLADYPPDAPPPVARWLAARRPTGWPAPLVATLIDLTGSVRSCKDTIRALDLHSRATGMGEIEILQLGARYEAEHEARDTIVQDIARAIRARDPSAAPMAPETEIPTPDSRPDPDPGPEPETEGARVERERLELEARGQTVLPGLPVAPPASPAPPPDAPPPVAPVVEVAPRAPLDPLPEDMLLRLREANRNSLRAVPLPDGSQDVYVRVGPTWVYVAPLAHPELAEFSAKIEPPAARPRAESPAAPLPPIVLPPSPPAAPERSQDDEDALAIGRAVLAAKRLGFKLTISVGDT